MSYLHYILYYIVDNPKCAILLALMLFVGIAYLCKHRTKNKVKYKKSTTSYSNNSSGSTYSYKPHNKNYIQEHNAEQGKVSYPFVVESVSQVFKSKTQGKSR